MSILHLRNIYAGQEVYVFASGSSLNYIPPSYFDNKICIATNRVGFVYGLKNYWTATHHYEVEQYYRKYGCKSIIIAPDKDINNLNMEPVPDSHATLRFPSAKQHYAEFSVSKHFPETDDRLVIGSSSFHTSLHLAQYMGASTIIIVGLDQGTLDGETNVRGYEDFPHMEGNPSGKSHHSFSVWEIHTRDMVNKMRELGCNVFSLNPFMNWNLEGHKFSGYQI
jgi:hypothetical protein